MVTKLSEVMFHKEISATELAKKVGISRTHLTLVKNGNVEASMKTWKLIAEALGVEVKEII